jgi:hypothetical protein
MSYRDVRAGPDTTDGDESYCLVNCQTGTDHCPRFQRERRIPIIIG